MTRWIEFFRRRFHDMEGAQSSGTALHDHWVSEPLDYGKQLKMMT